ncbi:MAG TPA: TIGR02206 family membrane protein [Terrimicrobiaceae bacterium]
MKATELQLFGPTHLWALTLIVIVGSIIAFTVRLARNPAVARSIALLLAALLVVNAAMTYGMRLATDRFDASTWLPMHLCDWAAIAAILALCFRWQLSYELAYFWGLGGTLQALLTPDIVADFPSIWFLVFFIGHGSVIVSVIFLTLALGMRPWPRSLLRAFFWSNAYLLCAGLVNYLFDANYGYLREKPQRASLLDYLGPWPIYIGALEIVVVLAFFVLYLPFLIVDSFRKRAKSGMRKRLR